MDKVIQEKLVQLAKNICGYSIKVKKGQNVFIIAWNESQPLVREIVKEINAIGANPFVVISDDTIDAMIVKDNPDAYAKHWGEMYEAQMKQMDCLINIRALDNEALQEAGENGAKKLQIMRPAYRVLTDDKPWVLLTYPTKAISKLFGKTQEEMLEFWSFASGFDYSKMDEAAKPLVDLMNKTDKVRITGPGTDLSFSMKDLGSVPCVGTRNIPDGEVYSSPVKDSVEGHITYTMPTPQGGRMLHNVKFQFEKGKIVMATCDGEEDTAILNQTLDTDPGARYIGEFAIGINPFISNAVGNILFDEKMKGSFHFTPGQSYKNESYNGNDSKVHWDIVCSQQAEHGGGEIYFDDVLIRKDGIFVIDELKGLNPEVLGKL